MPKLPRINLDHDPIKLNRTMISSLSLSMKTGSHPRIKSEGMLFRIMT